MRIGLVAATPADRDGLQAWAEQQGWTVVQAVGLLVTANATPDQVASALHITWQQMDEETGQWHADQPPTLPPGCVAVSGLSTRGRLYPHVRAHRLDNPTPVPVTGWPDHLPGPGYSPQQLWAAYEVSGPEDGTGTVIGILEWGASFQLSDIAAFCQETQLPPATVETVAVDGYTSGFDPATAVEATLDIAWAHAMAPGATIRVYMAPTGDSYVAWALQVTSALNAVLTDSITPDVLSISYGDAEESFVQSDLVAWEHLISALTAKGMAVLVSAGDQGAYGTHTLQQAQIRRVDAPASCPSALAVGGTSLYMQNATVEAEWAWANTGPYQGAGGGGVSAVWPTPSYQAALALPMRGVPDVAAVADPDPGVFLIVNGQPVMVGGTSVAAPVVAGLLARVAQARRTRGLGPLGDLHSVLYQHGATLCRDITVGNNTCFAVTGFAAQPGWDACTGWGAPLYSRWLATLAPQPDATADPKDLSVRQLADAAPGAFGSALLPLQAAARTVVAGLTQATYDGLAHHPVGWFDAAQRAAAQLWDAGVRTY